MKEYAEIAIGHDEDEDIRNLLVERTKQSASSLFKALSEIGFDIKFETVGNGTVITVFEWDQDALTRLRTRDSGRRRVSTPAKSPLRGMTISQAVRWLEEHDEQEGMAALGVSRSSYYRRRSEMKKESEKSPNKPFIV